MKGWVDGGRRGVRIDGWHKVQFERILMRGVRGWMDGGEGHVNRGRSGSIRNERVG